MIKSVSVRGQLVLPYKLRRKYGMTTGSTVNILDTGAGILIEPLSEDSEKRNFIGKSRIDGGPVLSFKGKRVLTSEQVAKLLEETE